MYSKGFNNVAKIIFNVCDYTNRIYERLLGMKQKSA